MVLKHVSHIFCLFRNFIQKSYALMILISISSVFFSGVML